MEADIKKEVRKFYDSVGWKDIGAGLYQNARYEDLRTVAWEYIHRCHIRVKRHLPASGKYILDAGSGPIQYPEYLEYSKGYKRRICLDISHLALLGARKRIGDHGFFVVGDAANLPFKPQAFDALVSLHTVHHIPADEHQTCFEEFMRVLSRGGQAVVVYSWGSDSQLMKCFRRPIAWGKRITGRLKRMIDSEKSKSALPVKGLSAEAEKLVRTPGTFTFRHDYNWIMNNLAFLPGLEVLVWRSVSTAFTKALVHRLSLGKAFLRLIFWLEERAPHFFGRVGQYPMIIFRKMMTEPEVTRADIS